MKKEIQITQYLLSLIAGSFFVISNAVKGWGTYEAQRTAIPTLVAYNILDIVLAKYWKTDVLMLIHHICVVVLGSYIYFLDGFTEDLYLISYYMSLGEISTIFNCLRWFYYNTEWESRTKLAFALTFLTFRPISNVGLIRTLPLVENKNVLFLFQIAAFVYTFLNMYWGALIIKKVYRHFSKSIPKIKMD